MMRRWEVFAFGSAAYLVALVTFGYLIAFVGGLPVPRTVDRGPAAGPLAAGLIDLALIVLFGVQHSLMARSAVKRRLRRHFPDAAQRSLFVLLSSLALVVLILLWRPLPAALWDAGNGWQGTALTVLFYLGWLGVLLATFLVDHFDLMGLRQVTLQLRGEAYEPPGFTVANAYRYVRHPMMLAFLVGFWATPLMSAGHLLLAVVASAYIVIGTALEERDLLRAFGLSYARYRERVPMLLPWPKAAFRPLDRGTGPARRPPER